ncbi:hypothetical protein O6H91_03G118800 [Diphasiastrum complanatum]|uniref:Uncharacterized protein n=2 Tax=Diphasiastrum complanatum TaxID=34168 RepID=A0ACC2EAY4_DIPCM|nr:hypothetical protein O6H91_03G118800 [Diphasiastrum complanatum]
MIAMSNPEGFESGRFKEPLHLVGGGAFGGFGLDVAGAEVDFNTIQSGACTDHLVNRSYFSVGEPRHAQFLNSGVSNHDHEGGGLGYDLHEGKFYSEQGNQFDVIEPDIPYEQFCQIMEEKIPASRAAFLEELFMQIPQGLDDFQEPNATQGVGSVLHQEQENEHDSGLSLANYGQNGGETSQSEEDEPFLSDGMRSQQVTDMVTLIQTPKLIDYDRPRMSNGSVLASDCLSATSPMMSHRDIVDMRRKSYSDGEVMPGNSGAALELSTSNSESRICRDSRARAQCIEIVSSDSESSAEFDDGSHVIDDNDCEISAYKVLGKRKLPNWALPEKEKEQTRGLSTATLPKSLGAVRPGKHINLYQRAAIIEENRRPAGPGERFFPLRKSTSCTSGGQRILPPTLSERTLGAVGSGPLPLLSRPPNSLNGASLHLANENDATLRTMLQEMASVDGREEASVAEDLMTVPLLKHQRIALAWMEKRENRVECPGGILADDQGLGKTVSTIALILKVRAPILKGDSSGRQLAQYNASAVDIVDDDEVDYGVDCLALSSTGPENIRSSVAAAPISANSVGRAKRAGKTHYRNNLSVKGRPAAGTLIVCPTSVLRQWDHEIRDKVTGAADLSVLVYHGPGRTKDPDEIAKYDVVLTTYAIVAMEVPKQPLPDEKNEEKRNLDDYGLCLFGNSSKFSKIPLDAKTSRKSHQNGKKRSSKRGNEEEESDFIPADAMGPLARVSWFRVVLDEAQSIKNCRTKVARACWSLRAKRRWCLSGTPIQNTVDDLYSYFRFLRYDPLDEYKSFRAQIKDPITRNPGIGYKKLQLILQTLMLRRTKATIIDGEPIVQLPPRIVSLKQIDFTDEERVFYNKLEIESRQKFQVYAAEGSLQKNYVNILWMLLRLRQACDHPLLVKTPKLETTHMAAIGSTGHLTLEQRSKLRNLLEGGNMICPICMDLPEEPVVSTCAHVFCRQCISEKLTIDYEMSCPDLKCQMPLKISSIYSLASLQDFSVSELSPGVPRGPNYDLARKNLIWNTSSKIDAVMKTLAELPGADNCLSEVSEIECDHKEEASTFPASKPLANFELVPQSKRQLVPATEKAIIFSQWTSMLDLLEERLKRSGFSYRRLDGTMTVVERDRAVLEFNSLPEVTVMIMSLKAASLGLNMIAACHVLLLDIWWNPTTEDQAIDRAHRIGQTRPVRVSRFTIKGTIEDRILALQVFWLESLLVMVSNI